MIVNAQAGTLVEIPLNADVLFSFATSLTEEDLATATLAVIATPQSGSAITLECTANGTSMELAVDSNTGLSVGPWVFKPRITISGEVYKWISGLRVRVVGDGA